MSREDVVKGSFSTLFEGVECNSIQLLSDEESQEVWLETVGSEKSSYFLLPDDNQIVTAEHTPVAEWVGPYNEDKNEKLATQLNQHLDWEDETRIYFLLNKKTTLESSWGVFLKHWDCFLAAGSDCTILTRRKVGSPLLIFYPHGEVIELYPLKESK